MNTLEEQRKLSESLIAACKAAGIEDPKYIMQGWANGVYHSEEDPRFTSSDPDVYNFMIAIKITHPPYATDWQESLLEWVEPQKTTEHVWSNWMIETKGEPLANVLARHPDHVADTSKMVDACDALAWRDGSEQPSGIESLVCADIAKRQQVGIAKYGTTLADNPLTLLEGLQHAYEESLDFPIYLKKIITDLQAMTWQWKEKEQWLPNKETMR